jgi:hypothetical protein
MLTPAAPRMRVSRAADFAARAGGMPPTAAALKAVPAVKTKRREMVCMFPPEFFAPLDGGAGIASTRLVARAAGA